MAEYTTKAAIKLALTERLEREGVKGEYFKLREFLKREGISDKVAWRIAAYKFPPADGAKAEVVDDPMYAEIQAGWLNGKYKEPPNFKKFPNGATNFREMEEPTPEAKAEVQKIKKAPGDWAAKWRDLAKAVTIPNADQVEEVQWVGAHRWTEPGDIDPATVPSKAAVCKLSAIQESSANYMEFLRTFESKLLPDRKQIEHQSKWRDDGRSLELIEEFEQAEPTLSTEAA